MESQLQSLQILKQLHLKSSIRRQNTGFILRLDPPPTKTPYPGSTGRGVWVVSSVLKVHVQYIGVCFSSFRSLIKIQFPLQKHFLNIQLPLQKPCQGCSLKTTSSESDLGGNRSSVPSQPCAGNSSSVFHLTGLRNAPVAQVVRTEMTLQNTQHIVIS